MLPNEAGKEKTMDTHVGTDEAVTYRDDTGRRDGGDPQTALGPTAVTTRLGERPFRPEAGRLRGRRGDQVDRDGS